MQVHSVLIDRLGLGVVFIIKSGVLKSPTIYFPFNYVNVCCIYFEALFGAHVFIKMLCFLDEIDPCV